MKTIARRDKMKIYGDLLSILQAERKETEKIVLIRVQAKLNVPFDRLKSYLSDLEGLGFIEDQTSYRLTQKGKQYLREYQKIVDFMERMGISYR
ncbi:MAG: winged helix-turn-helix domain-containing protein [Candidatus Bathyarchaeia archaeon]|jgi:predicted transcriptional regulator